METKDFRKYAHQLVDWMADYMENPQQHKIFPDTKPGEIKAQLPKEAPQQAEAFEQLFKDFQDIIVPGMTHWNHPGWFAYFPANNSPASVLAEMLTATLGAQCMSWQTSPAATELEQVVMEWLRKMVGFPETFTGVIQDTASTSTLVALLSAREHATKHMFGLRGATAPKAHQLMIYTSTHAHSSIDKAVKLAGFGLQNLRYIDVDENYAMRPDLLENAIENDLSMGLHPACVIATVGTTSSTAIDPLKEIGTLCDDYRIWLHVDAAYAGSTAILPEKRYIFDGIESVDSIVWNPHKWLMTNFDCSAYYVKDVEHLLRTFQANPEYLKTKYDKQVANFRDWGIPLGRRFRALKLWFVLRSYGVEGLQQILRSHIQLAQDFAAKIDASPDFTKMAPSPFGLVCFRYEPAHLKNVTPKLNAINQKLLQIINSSGEVYLTHTKLNEEYVLRLSVGQRTTQKEQVDRVWKLLQEAIASFT